MNRPSSVLLSFFLFFFRTLSSAASHEETSKFHGSYEGFFSKVYAFGGSETDTGNSVTSRLSDGRLVIDFVCEALSLPHLSPYKGGGNNFAIAGTTALPAEFFVSHNLSSPSGGVETQIEWFNKYQVKAGCNMENSLFWVGDLGVSDYIRPSVPLRDLADMSVRSVCKLLKTLLDNGARYLVVQGLPPVGCFPVYMSSNSQQKHDHMGCVASANKGVMNHNQILQHKLKKFRKLYLNTSILYADYWNAYLTILTNPKKHHIKETLKPCCCSNAACKDSISWDGTHLTESMNKNLTYLFFNQGFCRPPFDELVRSKRVF